MTRATPLVLVVDDFAAGRELCAEYLLYRGYEVATAADGAEALERAFALRPDAILMDLSLPEIDGWEATRRLRADRRTRAIKIIALTAHALETERDRALAAGCDEVVTKPIVPKELERVVRRQLGRETAPAEDGAERGAP
ncbi:MAG TPA: response regulator [Thermoanaerobaculia bacterium]|nr:response regulator [Thermoanaerobaculia bacterium]